MGDPVTAADFTREERRRYREKVKRCLEVFAEMLADHQFDPERRAVGLEIELNLTDEAGHPAMVNAQALEAIANADFQTEIGQFNLEINIAPHLLGSAVFSELEREVRASLNDAEARARRIGAHMVLIGILPTVTEEQITAETLTSN